MGDGNAAIAWGVSALLCVICVFWVAKSENEKIKAKVIGKIEIEQCFPVTTVSSTPTCTICLVPIQEEEHCRTLQCTHSFHADCILEWWTHAPRVSLNCPNCRMVQSVDKDAQRTVQP